MSTTTHGSLRSACTAPTGPLSPSAGETSNPAAVRTTACRPSSVATQATSGPDASLPLTESAFTFFDATLHAPSIGSPPSDASNPCRPTAPVSTSPPEKSATASHCIFFVTPLSKMLLPTQSLLYAVCVAMRENDVAMYSQSCMPEMVSMLVAVARLIFPAPNWYVFRY